MKIFILFLVLICNSWAVDDYLDVDISKSYTQTWTKIAKNEEIALKVLFNTLSQSSTGKSLLTLVSRKAKDQGKTLTDVIIPGDSSITDTTLVRRFSPHDPSVVAYETRSLIYLNRHLNVVDAVMDLAHEMTHYLHREPFNPYRPQFGLKEFIVSTVEGKGGEVDAYLVECQVFKDIFRSFESHNSRCSLVADLQGNLSKEKGIKEFYKVGNYYTDFFNDITKENLNKNDFPEIGADTPSFISSAYSLPYPLAAIKEYYTVMNKACQNDQKRIALIDQLQNTSAGTEKERSPASEKSDTWLQLRENFKHRCSSHLQKRY